MLYHVLLCCVTLYSVFLMAFVLNAVTDNWLETGQALALSCLFHAKYNYRCNVISRRFLVVLKKFSELVSDLVF